MRSTSLAAYDALRASGVLSRRRWEVVRWLAEFGPATRSEVDKALTPAGVPNGSHHKRLPELLRQGVVTTVGERICSVTGRKVLAWAVTGELPKTDEQKQSARRKLAAEVAALAERLDRLERAIGRGDHGER